jgi:hypothetical protein
VVTQLHQLTGPIYQHVISTFNTCLWGPTHRFLTDTGRAYNLGGAGFPHRTPRPSQPMVSTFHLRVAMGRAHLGPATGGAMAGVFPGRATSGPQRQAATRACGSRENKACAIEQQQKSRNRVGVASFPPIC